VEPGILQVVKLDSVVTRDAQSADTAAPSADATAPCGCINETVASSPGTRRHLWVSNDRFKTESSQSVGTCDMVAEFFYVGIFGTT
jgi:hypothetical protein